MSKGVVGKWLGGGRILGNGVVGFWVIPWSDSGQRRVVGFWVGGGRKVVILLYL